MPSLNTELCSFVPVHPCDCPAVPPGCLCDSLRLVLVVTIDVTVAVPPAQGSLQRCCSEELKNVDLSSAALPWGTCEGEGICPVCAGRGGGSLSWVLRPAV